MLKYTDAKVVFREVPGEISLAIDLSGCPFKCPGCHSPELQTDIGEEFDIIELSQLLGVNKGVTCICIMGGDGQMEDLKVLFDNIKYGSLITSGLKLAWYSGAPYSTELLPYLDYYKCGPYIKERGPLNSQITNQQFFSISHGTKGTYKVKDETDRFLIGNMNIAFDKYES